MNAGKDQMVTKERIGVNMAVVKDYFCEDCDILYEDIETSDGGVIPTCEKCKRDLKWIPSKMSFSSMFNGSHKHNYGKYGRRK